MKTNSEDLQAVIRKTIPLSQHMGYTINQLTERSIKVSAPLEKNYNIHGTAFAGSIYSVATLTGWALVYHILQNAKADATLVLAEAQIKYRTPIQSDLNCQAEVPHEDHQSFLTRLQNEGRSSLSISVDINQAATWEGKLTAIINKPVASLPA